MKRVIAFPLDGGGSVQIEVEEECGAAPTRGLHPGDVVDKVGGSFEAALLAVRPAVAALASTLRGLADAPGEVEIEFGLKFSGQAGAFIASAGTEAQFRVKMAWQHQKATWGPDFRNGPDEVKSPV